jgi:hypothetical protein
MPRKGSIDRLPAEIRTAADAALKRGATIDEVVAVLGDLGAEVSRSAVGRYAQRWSRQMEKMREIEVVSRGFAAEVGGLDDKAGKLIIQMVQTLIAHNVMPLIGEDGEAEKMSPMDVMLLAKALQHTVAAGKIDTDRDAKIREEGRKAGLDQAAKAAGDAGRRAGADARTIETIKREILGLKAD